MTASVLMIDNLDSFTFNLVEAIERLGAKVRVLRNSIPAADALAAAEQSGSHLILSPGPGRPEDAGCCLELLALAKGRVPVLGVCLGHQAMVLEAGGDVDRAPAPVHGKTSVLVHDGQGPFEGIDGPVQIGRYHSLCTRNIPGRFTVHAETEGMAMAISDDAALQTGLQFHPESILTPLGNRILANILLRPAPVRQQAA
ncbi:anthranilate synthase component II [Allosphingosinicella deserti]|uniref:anthranilate synthase n=1 Tax=Allosphingosinicella deserti TaxID=2116704 RepID=A0A2P7QGL5_9SPHN|nr:aminodeoxychorismate/anthranilate synthase component II [Sphingomonas deserti]PSJ37121.1 pyocyanine specific anthranilate synthase component II [Sphingomonas deserti]